MFKLFNLKGKKSGDQFPCLNIYPKSMGGVKYEVMDKVEGNSDLWRKEEDGKYYYLQKWDEGKESLVPYYPLPEVIEVGADYVARMLSCPYVKLKQLKVGVWAHLKDWIPVVVLLIAFFLLIIVGGME